MTASKSAPQSASALIWKTMSGINVNEHSEKKGNLTYLSWTWALQTLMDRFPNTEFTFTDRIYDDGSMEVTCRLTIIVDGCDPSAVSRTMWLPVMDNRNNAIQNPNARQISDTKMRCLVKTIAVTTGLGLYIFAGEDIPKAEKDELNRPISLEEGHKLLALLEHTSSDIKAFCNAFGVKAVLDLPQSKLEKAMDALDRKLQAMEASTGGME